MPTLLIYGHYDVQPADPLAEWRTPPFTPIIIGDDLYVRSASDNKGQVMAVMAALVAWLQTSGRLPVNVKLLIEGEEEVSSTALHHFVVAAAGRLHCDAVLFVDSMMLSPQWPLILYGTRGNCYLEVTMRRLATDLHSGTFGGVVDNPFNVLVRLLTALQDGDTGRVLVSGFYHNVREVDDAECALITQLPVSEQAWLALTGTPALSGETGCAVLERASIRPTLDIHGIGGGFTGPGKKTVIQPKRQPSSQCDWFPCKPRMRLPNSCMRFCSGSRHRASR
ncbi:M20/M25/M40 family metallo-hydrolase [uncultured Chloroflexus sp.]|uniref:M20/M25/M40 family metallo-hydrolase n=2 Tax=uncultured Chloroflexus sp. TaxID=214040 RepID=UPI0026125E72|nr:M20/M25/M40 family metallo-hydrolase [uncultured Chloroflexus sp.]